MSKQTGINNPSAGKSFLLTLAERKMLVQGLTDSITLMGTEIPEDEDDRDIRRAKRERLRDRLATPAQRKEFKR